MARQSDVAVGFSVKPDGLIPSYEALLRTYPWSI